MAGVVTDRDVALATLAQGRDPDATKLAELVDLRPAVVVHEDSPLGVAAGMMRRHAIRRLPVLDANEQLIGVIASDDLLRIVAGEIGGLARTVEAQTPDRTREMPIGDVSGPEVE